MMTCSVALLLVVGFTCIAGESQIFSNNCNVVSRRVITCRPTSDELQHLTGKKYHGILKLKLSGMNDDLKILMNLFPDLKFIEGGRSNCESLVGDNESKKGRIITVNHRQCYSTSVKALLITDPSTLSNDRVHVDDIDDDGVTNDDDDVEDDDYDDTMLASILGVTASVLVAVFTAGLVIMGRKLKFVEKIHRFFHRRKQGGYDVERELENFRSRLATIRASRHRGDTPHGRDMIEIGTLEALVDNSVSNPSAFLFPSDSSTNVNTSATDPAVNASATDPAVNTTATHPAVNTSATHPAVKTSANTASSSGTTTAIIHRRPSFEISDIEVDSDELNEQVDQITHELKRNTWRRSQRIALKKF
ncbi:uncharacterized protein [Haliotis asinina]|uniref:uncharacterized protein isoform X2 n=1 Tax=Haliotis asinina TaxID=109174 RepID=UPI0035321065